jgi:hypothetical protein
VKTQKQ